MGKAIIPTDAEIEAIRAKSEVENAREIRAAHVDVSPDRQMITLVLVGRAAAGNTVVSFPVQAEPQLAALTPEQLAELEVYPGGTTLACDAADLHLSVEALVFKALMGPEYHLHLRRFAAATMGKASSEAKREAARANGARGGRPRKRDTDPKTYGLPEKSVPKSRIELKRTPTSNDVRTRSPRGSH